MGTGQEINIAAIVEQCRQGDMDALRVLYVSYYTNLLNVARRYVDDDTAHDVVHDAILMAFTSLNTLHDDSKIEAWLSRIVRNMALNHIKHERIIQAQPIETIRDIPDEVPDEPLVPFDVLMSMVKRLPNGYEQVFRLRTLAGLSHDEISQRLGITSSTSRSQFTHARRMLKAMVQHWWIAVVTLVATTVLLVELNRHDGAPGRQTPADTKTAQEPPKAMPHIDSLNANDQQRHQRHLAETAPASHFGDTASCYKQPVDTVVVPALSQPSDTTGQPSRPAGALPYPLNPALPLAQDGSMPHEYRGLQRPSSSGMSLNMAFSGLPERFDRAQAATITGISSTAATGDKTDVVPIDFNNWTDYFNFINEEAEIKPTDENLSLRRIAESNALGNPNQEIEERVKHDVPITVSLSLNKNITDRLALGSGISYTRLHSTFDVGYERAFISNEQTIHYVGIPVNASYTFLRNSRWSLYGSAGLALDIPVANTWQTEHVLNGQSIFSKSSSFTLPVQWSVTTGVGLQYNLTPHIGIFVQPSGTYYFDNGTKTIRSAHPWSVTIPTGLRFTW